MLFCCSHNFWTIKKQTVLCVCRTKPFKFFFLMAESSSLTKYALLISHLQPSTTKEPKVKEHACFVDDTECFKGVALDPKNKASKYKVTWRQPYSIWLLTQTQMDMRRLHSNNKTERLTCTFFLLIALWSRHVKPSSAKGEKRLKRKKIPKFVQAEALPESEIMYKSKDHCTGMKDRITRDREIQRYAKTYQKPSPQTSVHLEQQVELRKKIESGSTIADSEAA